LGTPGGPINKRGEGVTGGPKFLGIGEFPIPGFQSGIGSKNHSPNFGVTTGGPFRGRTSIFPKTQWGGGKRAPGIYRREARQQFTEKGGLGSKKNQEEFREGGG